jgi:tRNA A-37 threonylcarbamoyl transferase component Bud32
VTASAAGVPESIGPYRLLEKLGHGGMATVFRGERVGEAGFKKKVAIKRILPQYRRDPSLLERFAAEARTNARLDHPNLVQVIDFGIDPEPYLVLEFVEGVSLSQILQRLVDQKKTLELAAALFIGAEAAQGLDHAHRKKDDDGTPLGIVHRDVSPQNVLVSNEGGVKVSDFGLVKAADNVLKTASGVSIGKISYMAPEQARGETIDARADIFSMGVMLWEMLTLRSLIPPEDPGRAATLLQSGAFDPPSRHNPRVPERLDRLVLSCLAVDLEQRMPTAQQLSLELRELLHEMAPGYGRQQLARLVAWLFPEKGWAIAEPDLPAQQPSTEERLSIPMVTPAAVAMQRAAATSSVPPAPVAPKQAIPMPSAPGSRARRVVIVVLSALLVLIGAVAIVAIVVAVYFAHRSATAAPAPSAVPPATTRAPMIPSSPTQDLVVMISSPVTGARLFMGARDLGPMPMSLHQHDLTGEPLIAVAAGHEPRVIRAELLIELMRTQPAYVIQLAETDSPDLAAYVRYTGQGLAHLPGGEDLGPVPGVVIIPVEDGEPAPSQLIVWDESDVELAPLSLAGCASDRVCLLTAIPAP